MEWHHFKQGVFILEVSKSHFLSMSVNQKVNINDVCFYLFLSHCHKDQYKVLFYFSIYGGFSKCINLFFSWVISDDRTLY